MKEFLEALMTARIDELEKAMDLEVTDHYPRTELVVDAPTEFGGLLSLVTTSQDAHRAPWTAQLRDEQWRLNEPRIGRAFAALEAALGHPAFQRRAFR